MINYHLLIYCFFAARNQKKGFRAVVLNCGYGDHKWLSEHSSLAQQNTKFINSFLLQSFKI